jgi:hypothetical protein
VVAIAIVALGLTASVAPVASAALVVRGGMAVKWRELGSERWASPVNNEYTIAPGVQRQDFSNGWFFLWTEAHGAHPMGPGIAGKWAELGRTNWAVPISSERNIGRENNTGEAGVRQNFSNGWSIVWSEKYGAHPVGGGIGGAWGFDVTHRGLPTTDETVLAPGVVEQKFSLGYNWSVIWSESHGAHWVGGGIGAKWRELDGPAWGVPTSNETIDGAGTVVQRFSGGKMIVFSQHLPEPITTTTHTLFGAMAVKFEALRFGDFGAPTSEEFTLTDGIQQQNFLMRTGLGYGKQYLDSALIWSEKTGANLLRYGFFDKWKALGGAEWGIPTADAKAMDNFIDAQEFTGNKTIFEDGGMNEKGQYEAKLYVLQNQYRTHYLANGGYDTFGAPTADEITTTTNRGYQTFAKDKAICWDGNQNRVWTANGQAELRGCLAR